MVAAMPANIALWLVLAGFVLLAIWWGDEWW